MNATFFRRFLVSTAVLLVCIMVSGCMFSQQPSSSLEKEKVQVAATIFPLYSLVDIVAGDAVDVVQIIPAGASPHFFEPKPSLIQKLQGSDAIFLIGADFDSWANDLTESLPNADIISLVEYVSVQTGEYHSHTHDEHDDHDEFHDQADGIDPHYWLSPENAKKMVEQIVVELSQIDPENSEIFIQNAEKFLGELEQKNADWTAQMEALDHTDLITFHDAFEYFAHHFGLEIVATFEPFAGQEPTAQYLVDLKEEIFDHGVRSIYLEPQMPKTVIEQFAKDNNLSVGVLDPIGGVLGRMNYIELIEYNVNAVLQAQ